MNFYKFIKDFKAFYDDTIKGANEMAQKDPEFAKMWTGKFECLEPFMKDINMEPWLLKEQNHEFFGSTNNRIDIFLTESNEVVYAAYSQEAAASNSFVKNSHSSLCLLLASVLGYKLEYEKRWCGFYTRLFGNGQDSLVLYGMSSDYPHNEHSEYVLGRFAEKILCYSVNPYRPKEVFALDENIHHWTEKSFELPF